MNNSNPSGGQAAKQPPAAGEAAHMPTRYTYGYVESANTFWFRVLGPDGLTFCDTRHAPIGDDDEEKDALESDAQRIVSALNSYCHEHR